jgi:hypothetical protein
MANDSNGINDTQEKFHAAIVVTKLTPPQGRSVSYRVDTRAGNVLWIYKTNVALLRVGDEYDVEGNIKGNFHNITAVKRLGPAPEDDEPAVFKPAEKKKMEYYRPRDPDERREIFVCALLCRDMEMGRDFMSKALLIERGKIHKAVWQALFGAPADDEEDLVQQVKGRIVHRHQSRGG